MDPTAILHRAVDEAARLLRTDGAMAYLLDEATGILRFATDAGITDDQRRAWVRSLKVDIGVGMFGQAVAERRGRRDRRLPGRPVLRPLPRRRPPRRRPRDPLVPRRPAQSAAAGCSARWARSPAGPTRSATRRSRSSGPSPTTPPRRWPTPTSSSSWAAPGRTSSGGPRRSGPCARSAAGSSACATRRRSSSCSVDEAARLLAADGARIDVLDEATGGLYWAYDATTGHRPGLGPIAGTGEAKAGEGISGKAVREMQPIFTGDYLNDDRFEHASAPDAHVRRYEIRSVVAVPLIGDRGPLGTLTVYTGRAATRSARSDARIIEALAGQAAIAMTNARLIEELDRSREQFSHQADAERALREIAARITAIRDPTDLLQHVVDEAARLLRAERVRIDLIMPAAGRVGFTHVPGAGDIIGGAAVDDERPAVHVRRVAARRSRPAPDGRQRRLLERRRLRARPRPRRGGPRRRRQVADRHAAVRRGRAARRAPGRGAETWTRSARTRSALVEALAHQAAIAIQNARLIEAIAASREEIRRRARAEQALREIATRITAIRDPADLLKQVVDAVARPARRRPGRARPHRARHGARPPRPRLGRWRPEPAGPDRPGGVRGDRGINGLAIAHRRAVVDRRLPDRRPVHPHRRLRHVRRRERASTRSSSPRSSPTTGCWA